MLTEPPIPAPSVGVPATSTGDGWTPLCPSPRPRPGEAIDVDPATSPHVRPSLVVATDMATGCVLGLDVARRGDDPAAASATTITPDGRAASGA